MQSDLQSYRERWRALWKRIGGQGTADDLLDDLVSAHAEPRRRYHTLDHVLACLESLDAAREVADNPDAVELALWFHDAIYDPRADDNEARSAAWASECLTARGISDDLARRVAELILATRHDDIPSDPDARLTADIDLAILGVAAGAFDRYEEAVRREYSWLPAAVFDAGRSAILQRLLARDVLYQTAALRRKYERQARANIERSLRRLAGNRERDREPRNEHE